MHWRPGSTRPRLCTPAHPALRGGLLRRDSPFRRESSNAKRCDAISRSHPARAWRAEGTPGSLSYLSDLFERIDRNYEYRRSANLHLNGIRHEELARLGHWRHWCQVTAPLAAVVTNYLHCLGHSRILNTDDESHVALLEESAAGCDAGRAEADGGQRLRCALRVLAVDIRDDELHFRAEPASIWSTLAITAACTLVGGSVPSITVKRFGSAAAS